MFQFELKRIVSKKINLFVIGVVLLLAVVFSGFAVTSNRYVDENGTVYTGILATRMLAENKAPWKGVLMEETLAQVILQNRNAKEQYSEEDLDQNYGTVLQPMDDLRNFMISVLTPDSEYDETVLDSLSEEEILNFYRIYQRNMENMAEIYGKTPVQKVFLEKMYDGISLPLQYEAYGAWDTILLYVEIYSILLAIVVGFLCAGIFADDFQTKADAVFFATKYGRTKAIKIKILTGMVITTVLYVSGMGVLSVICFGVMGVSGGNTPYQIAQVYSIYHMTYSHYYLLAVACGYIACLFAAALCMLVAAKMHTISVAVCIPFFLYCFLPFLGRALSEYAILFTLIPTVLTNVETSAKVPFVYQIGKYVVRQIPLVMGMYSIFTILLLPWIYKTFQKYRVTL